VSITSRRRPAASSPPTRRPCLTAAGDARALAELERLLPILSNEADLLDSETLKTKASRAAQLLTELKEAHRREDAVELEKLLAPPRAPAAPPPTAPLPSSEAAADNELRQIFVEEASEAQHRR
jgi:hypothetical protein